MRKAYLEFQSQDGYCRGAFITYRVHMQYNAYAKYAQKVYVNIFFLMIRHQL